MLPVQMNLKVIRDKGCLVKSMRPSSESWRDYRVRQRVKLQDEKCEEHQTAKVYIVDRMRAGTTR